MGLAEKDKQDFKKGIHEIYSILGSSQIYYLPLDPTFTPSIYSEKRGATYLDPIPLVGKYTMSSNEYHAHSGVTTKPEDTLTVFIPMMELELKELDPFVMTKGLFRIDGKDYSITLTTPKGLLSDMYIGYTFSCKGVDFI